MYLGGLYLIIKFTSNVHTIFKSISVVLICFEDPKVGGTRTINAIYNH